ncbi:MAG: hypothetical protein EOO07_37740 [Chitinophagaceae bacterium]|nr:MAG: hypothetical protein EOO07_37740 [Chitinophagaceae bacterium]
MQISIIPVTEYALNYPTAVAKKKLSLTNEHFRHHSSHGDHAICILFNFYSEANRPDLKTVARFYHVDGDCTTACVWLLLALCSCLPVNSIHGHNGHFSKIWHQ